MLHEFWLNIIQTEWQKFMQNYYDSHMKKFSLDQLECGGSKQSSLDFNFRELLFSNTQQNNDGFIWTIDDDGMHALFKNFDFIAEDDYQIRYETDNLQHSFDAIVNEYTEKYLLKDYTSNKEGSK